MPTTKAMPRRIATESQKPSFEPATSGFPALGKRSLHVISCLSAFPDDSIDRINAQGAETKAADASFMHTSIHTKLQLA